MKKLLLLLLLLPALCRAQDSTTTPASAIQYLEKSVWRLEFFGPGTINESRIGKQTTFVSQLRMVGSFYFYSQRNLPGGQSMSYSAYTFNPQLSASIRQFYNFARRLEKGKSIRYNSGNYVSARLYYTFPPVIRHNTDRAAVRDIQGVTAEAVWGFQRTYRKNFYLNLEVGLGVGSRFASPVGITNNFTLGYTFRNKQ